MRSYVLADRSDFDRIANSIPQSCQPHYGRRYGFISIDAGSDADVPRETNNGWGSLALIHPDDARPTNRASKRCLFQCEAPYAIGCRIRGKDGVYRWHECRAMPVRMIAGASSSGSQIGTVSRSRSRTVGSRRACERLRRDGAPLKTLSLLETLQASAPVGFGFVDREFRQVRINEALAVTTSLTVEQNIGRTVAEVIPELWPELEPVFQPVLETGRR